VFTRIGGVWTQQGNKLVDGALGGANQGTSVALSADGTTARIVPVPVEIGAAGAID
jgi:hypothetical protein